MEEIYTYTPRKFVNGELESAEGTNAVSFEFWGSGMG